MNCPSCGEPCAEPVRGASPNAGDRIVLTIRCAHCDYTWTKESDQPMLFRKSDRRAK